MAVETLAQLMAYIPSDRQQALVDGVSLPAETHGAALFADISGFTPLTAALAEELGPQRGAEELTHQLNRVYEALVHAVHRFGGSVITFAGDAITCWFDKDDGHRAVRCGFEMQAFMQTSGQIMTPAGTEVKLAIKVAAAVGPARRFVVGDPDIQLIDALVGPTLDRMAQAEKFAEKGEVVVDLDMANMLGGWLMEAERRFDEDGYGVAVIAEIPMYTDRLYPSTTEVTVLLAENAVRSWLLKPIYERIRETGGQFLAEIRPVTVLFLRFTGLDFAADSEVGDKLDQYIRWVQSVINRYGGYLLQLTFGDKGNLFYATFGAPVAHEDNAVRAVAAAVELRDIPTHLSYIPDVQIGISEGAVYAGAYGSNRRQTYGVLGSETNIAARYMAKAEPGQVLLRERVAKAVETLFHIDYLGETYVKGIPFPVGFYLVGERLRSELERPNRLYNTPLVGRNDELAQVDRALDDVVRQNTGRLLHLTAAAGMGKSHFAAVVVEHAQSRGIRVASGVCPQISQGRAFVPWQQIFRSLLGLSEEINFSEIVRDALERQISLVQMQLTLLNPDWVLRLPLLGDLLGLPVPDTPLTAELTPRLRRESLFALLQDILETMSSKQPLLIMLEDVQWIDETSRELLEAIMRSFDRNAMMLFVGQRPTQEPIFATDVLGDTVLALPLEELTLSATGDMIRDLLRGRPSTVLISLVQHLANGNPFFIEELIDLFLETKFIELRDDATWHLSREIFTALEDAGCLIYDGIDWHIDSQATLPAMTVRLPDSVYASVLARLDRLPDSDKLTIKVAAVIGQTFTLNLVTESHPRRPPLDQMRQSVGDLRERDFVREDPRSVEQENIMFLFKHNTVHEVSYGTLLTSQRSQLHREVANAIERNNPDAVAAIAHHAFLGEDWTRALDYHVRAAKQARRIFATQEAIDFVDKALVSASHIADDDVRADQLEGCRLAGELLTETGRYEEAFNYLSQAYELAIDLEDQEGLAAVVRWLVRWHELQGQYDPALEWFDKGLAAIGDQVVAERVELLLLAGLINSRRGETARAAELCEEAIRDARALGIDNGLARGLTLLGHLSRLQGASHDAVEHFRQALSLYEQVGNLHGEAIVHNQLATGFAMQREFVDATYHFRNARLLFDQMGDLYNRAIADNNLGQLSLDQDQVEIATSAFQAALDTMRQIGQSPYLLGFIEMNLGASYIARDLPTEARHHLAQSRAYADTARVRDFLPELHRHFARAALVANELDEALSNAHTAATIAEELGMREEVALNLRIQGDVYGRQQEPDHGIELLDQSLAIFSELNNDYERAKTQLLLARQYAQRGELAGAMTLASAAEATFRVVGADSRAADAAAFLDSL